MRRLAERSPALFSPTSFPCTAWYVTESLYVRETTVKSAYGSFNNEFFVCTKPTFFHRDALFATRAEAVAEAERKLVVAKERYVKRGQRIERQQRVVLRMRKGGVE